MEDDNIQKQIEEQINSTRRPNFENAPWWLTLILLIIAGLPYIFKYLFIIAIIYWIYVIITWFISWIL